MSAIIIRRPDDAEFEVVKKYVDLFWLDNSHMRRGQFKILLFNGVIAAFVRLKKHAAYSELCTLGVIKRLRGRHLGMALIRTVVDKAKQDTYIVTVEPGYFRKTGFRLATRYPAGIREKIKKCRAHFAVGKPYRVMIRRHKKAIAR